MANFYERRILPKLLTCACASPPMMKQRAKIVPLAEGRVLELGVGMGLNLALYDAAKVASVAGVDPAAELRAQAMAAGLPHARMVVVPGAGHAANLTHPQPVNAALAPAASPPAAGAVTRAAKPSRALVPSRSKAASAPDSAGRSLAEDIFTGEELAEESGEGSEDLRSIEASSAVASSARVSPAREGVRITLAVDSTP